MTLLELFLNFLKQFGLVPPDRLSELWLEVEEFQKTAIPSNENDKVKQMYGKVHKGEYGLFVRVIVMPVVYYFIRKEFHDMEKEEDLGV